MKLSTIWQVSTTDREEFTLVDAWDEYTVGDNREGFDEKLEELGAEMAPGYALKVVEVDVEDDLLEKALFSVPTLEGRLSDSNFRA